MLSGAGFTSSNDISRFNSRFRLLYVTGGRVVDDWRRGCVLSFALDEAGFLRGEELATRIVSEKSAERNRSDKREYACAESYSQK